MELNYLYKVDEETLYEAFISAMPKEINKKIEIMFKNKVGLIKIESLIKNKAKENNLPKAIQDNFIRAIRWKYIQMMD